MGALFQQRLQLFPLFGGQKCHWQHLQIAGELRSIGNDHKIQGAVGGSRVGIHHTRLVAGLNGDVQLFTFATFQRTQLIGVEQRALGIGEGHLESGVGGAGVAPGLRIVVVVRGVESTYRVLCTFDEYIERKIPYSNENGWFK